MPPLIADAIDPELASLLKMLGLGGAGAALTFLAAAGGLYFRFRKQWSAIGSFDASAKAAATTVLATAEAEAVRVAAVARAEAARLMAEAAATPIGQYQSILADVRTELAAMRVENRECHDRGRRQQTEIDGQRSEIDGLKRQNTNQQAAMDAQSLQLAATQTSNAVLREELARLKAALHSQGLSAGSGTLPSLDDDPTDEHDPLPG
ncbi:MAG TPA: hypothetical protein VD866_08080 [Urbifossiella sp.]|nr:hypothetical protein [Urbifossiella sp.]